MTHTVENNTEQNECLEPNYQLNSCHQKGRLFEPPNKGDETDMISTHASN